MSVFTNHPSHLRHTQQPAAVSQTSPGALQLTYLCPLQTSSSCPKASRAGSTPRHTPFTVLAPMPLVMQPQDERALLSSFSSLAPRHSPFCSYPGWPAGGLNCRRQIFADRGNVLSQKTLGRCLCLHSQEVKQGAGPGKEQPEALHLWGSLGTAHPPALTGVMFKD